MKPRSNPFLRSAALAASISLSHPSHAANIYWDNGAAETNPLWATTNNWATTLAGSTNPAAFPGAGDVAYFNITGLTAAQTINLNGPQAALGLVFNSVTSSGVTIKASSSGTADQTFSLGASGITINSGAGTVDWGTTPASNGNMIISLAASQTWLNAGANHFNWGDSSSVASLSRAANSGHTLTFNTTSTGLFKASIQAVPNTNGIIGPWAFYGTGANTKYAFNDAGTIAALTGTVAATAADVTDTTGTANYDLAAVGAFGSGANFNTLRYTGLAGTITGDWSANGLMNVNSTALVLSGAGSIGSTNELVVNTVNAADSIELSGAIGNNGTNASSIAKAGAGNLILSNANTYSGTTTVGGTGSLVITHANALGDTTSGTVVNSGAALELRGITTPAGESVTITGFGPGTGVPGALRAGAGGGTWAGMVIIGSTADTRVGALAGQTLTITGSVVGSGAAQSIGISGQSGTGKVIFNPTTNHSYAGATTVQRGILELGNSNVIPDTSAVTLGATSVADANQLNMAGNSETIYSLAHAGTVTQSTVTNSGASLSTLTIDGTGGTGSQTYGGNILVGTGNIKLVKKGGTTQTLTGANTFTGGVEVTGGTLGLNFSATATNILAPTNVLTLGNGSTGLTLTGKASTTNSQTLASTTLNTGAAQITMTANATANPLKLDLQAITRNTGATMNITQPAGTISATNGVITSTGNTNGILGGWATVGAADWAVANGTSGITVFTSYTALPTSGASGTTNYNVITNTSLAGSQAINSLKMAGTATTALDLGANDLTISSGGITTVATNITQNITGTTGGLIAANNELIVHANTSGTSGLNISALIKDNGANAVTLTKSGAQTLTLSGANSYSGGTVLNAGTITIASDGNLGAVPSVATAGNLVLNGGTLNTSATMTLNANRGVQLNGVVGISPNANTTLTMAGDIIGSGLITKNTAGSTLILSGTNNFTGPAFGDLGPLTAGLVLNGGKVVLANTAALGASGNSIGLSTGANSSLEIATDSAVNTHGLQMSSNNAGTIILSRATPGAAYNQPFAMSALGNNVLNVLAGSNITSGTPSISIAGLNLTAGNVGNMTLKPVGTTISVTGSVFIGSNNYAKTLALDGTSTGNLVSANLFDGGIGSALSLAKSNSSTWTLSSVKNTFTGTTSVTGGTLRLDYSTNNTSKLADGAALTLGGGTLELSGGSHTETVGSTILTANTTSKVTRTSGSGVLQMNTITANTNAAINFAGDNIASTDTLNNTTTGILGPWATVTNAGVTDWAINTTNGADGLIAAYSGYANIDRLAGSVPNTAAANVRITEGGSSGNITLAASTTQINTLKMEAAGGPGVIALAGQTLSIGVSTGGAILLDAGAGALTIGSAVNDGTLTTGATADATPATLRFTNMSTTNALLVNSVIANNGTDVVSIATSGAGKITLAGTNTFTGTVNVGEGELELANAAALPTAATVNLASSGTLNLNGNSVTISNLGGDATGIVTDKSGGAGTTSLTISTVQGNPAIRQLFADGPSKKIQVVLYNGNADSRVLDNPLNTFSGGLVLGQNSSGTRLVMSATPQTTGTAGALTNGIYGTGPIIVGQGATEKAGIFISGNGVTVLNDVISNTTLGTDRVGTFRIDSINNVLAGTLTAGAAPMALSTNGTGSVTVTGKITGTNGFQLLSHDLGGTSLTATLANTGATNDYQGDTIINQAAVAGRSYSLVLGASDQIPNGTGKGNVVVNTATTGVGTLNLNGFSETINGLSGNGTVTSATAATLTVGDNDATGAANTFSGAITGSAAVTKIGAGTLTLSGTNTYTGATSITGGLLEIASTGSLAAGSAVTVSNSGSQFIVNGTVNGSLQVNTSTTLSGSGTIATATIDGILAPGNSIGTLNAVGDVTWNDNDAWVFELGGAASTLALASSGSSIQDMLNITGNFNKGSGTSFTFNFGGVADNGYYKLVDWTGTTGFASGDFFASNLASGQSGSFIVDNDTSALYLNVIPEPSTTMLGILGTLALLRRRRSA